ncbi:MAG: FAD-binding protein [Verrucomicrobiota bacterium]|nr:FAD-binding protein [Verrucomicrobiota bacterium]
MRIIVPIKQVPETKAVKMDENTGTIIRDGVESIINPLDLYAIELAIQLKEKYGGEIVTLTMGPPKAEEALREAVAMGIDTAFLVSDRVFAGSDTYATSYILSEAIRKQGKFDIIICGERATDGDTGQVGPGIAAFLDLPVLSYVNHFVDYKDNLCKVHRLVEEGNEILTTTLPALLTVVKEVCEPRLPTLRGKKRAKKLEIPVFSNEELKLDNAELGLKGSPTKVAKIFRPKVARACKKLTATDEKSLESSVAVMIEFMKRKMFIVRSSNTKNNMEQTSKKSSILKNLQTVCEQSSSVEKKPFNLMSNYKDIWILAEQFEGRILDISYELLTRAQDLATKRKTNINAMLFGNNIGDQEINKLILRGADKVVFTDAPELKFFLPETYYRCMIDLIERFKPEIILAGATSTGRTLMPYVAIKANAGLTADCTELDFENETGNLLQTRPAIGGNIMATIKTPEHRPQMATIRPKSTPKALPKNERKGEIIRITPPAKFLKTRVTRKDLIKTEDQIPLQNAEKVVVVGRGIKKAENLPLIKAFADKIGAAIGASRDVVDRGWLSYAHQVGLSGKTITPKLYIGIGVSGAIQHLAGMQTAEISIAVNSDPDAQIFKVADFGIVGDLFEVIPELTKQIRLFNDLMI